MLVKEAKSLAGMAKVLGKNSEAHQWREKAQRRAALINKFMWDPQTGFYYNVNMKNNSFTYKKPNDLKRQEIIGFLPLWAGIATKRQASILIKTLTNPDKFWRKFGVPSLSADDPYYNPEGYWNGPVWVQWNYMIEDGLLKYGYDKLAKELVNRVSENMISQLKKNHTLWEFYSPDSKWGGHHQTYIWAGIINRMFLDLDRSSGHIHKK
jgi:glycogen debranching enzyme